jgi:hypothetical protein
MTLSGKIPSGLATPLAPAALGGLGSHFWALVEDSSDSNEEMLVGSEQKLDEGQGGSPRSLPAQRTLGDFLGND